MKAYSIIIVFFMAACSKSNLYEYPSSNSKDAEITNFSVLNEAGQSVATAVEVTKETGRISVKVSAGTNISKLVPRATVSEGVVIEPGMGIYTDFSKTKTYTLIAGDRVTKKEWTVIVSE